MVVTCPFPIRSGHRSCTHYFHLDLIGWILSITFSYKGRRMTMCSAALEDPNYYRKKGAKDKDWFCLFVKTGSHQESWSLCRAGQSYRAPHASVFLLL